MDPVLPRVEPIRVRKPFSRIGPGLTPGGPGSISKVGELDPVPTQVVKSSSYARWTGSNSQKKEYFAWWTRGPATKVLRYLVFNKYLMNVLGKFESNFKKTFGWTQYFLIFSFFLSKNNNIIG